MKFVLIFFGLALWFACFEKVQAQEEEPQPEYDFYSSDPSATISGVSPTVDLFSGTARIDLPIYEVKSTFLSIPVSLSYNAKGVKVQDVPTWVGTGWHLNAGGMITRVVKGLPDEVANGFCGTNNVGEKASSALTHEYIKNISNGTWDGAPDVFYLKLPNYSGRIYLDANGHAIASPHAGLEIQPGICNSGTLQWTITDPMGVKYVLGKEATHREYTQVNSGPSNLTTWYLSEVIDANSLDKISFSYVTGLSVSTIHYRQKATKEVFYADNYSTSCGDGNTFSPVDDNLTLTIAAPRYLSQIQSKYCVLELDSRYNRQDLQNGKLLAKINVKNTNEVLLWSYAFYYGYFQTPNCTTTLCKRLKLLRVNKESHTAKLQVYSFDYDPLNLPSRDSHAVDHWGYFNNNGHTSKLPSMVDVNYNWSDCAENREYVGANKEPDLQKTVASILTKIILPTGGYFHFLYDQHQYRNTFDPLNIPDRIAGGARVKSVSKCELSGNCMTTEYLYTSNAKSTGRLYQSPHYSYRTHWTKSFLWGGWQKREKLHVMSESIAELFDANGVHVGYNSVKIHYPDGSYVISNFDGFETKPDVNDGKFIYEVPDGVGSNLDKNYPPFNTYSSRADERGVLKTRMTFSPTDKRLQDEIFEYECISGWKKIPSYSSMNLKNYIHFVGKTYVGTSLLYQKKHTVKTYDPTTSNNDLSTFSANVSEQVVSHDLMLPSRLTRYNQNYPYLKFYTDIRYPQSFSTSLDCENMYQTCLHRCDGVPEQYRPSCLAGRDCYAEKTTCENAVETNPNVMSIKGLLDTKQYGVPVEILNVKSDEGIDRVLSASYNIYQRVGSNQVFLPKETYVMTNAKNMSAYQQATFTPETGAFAKDADFRKTHDYLSYNASTGKILSERGLDGITTTNEWTDLHLTKVTINPNTNSDWQHTQMYSHKPLVGVTSIIDQNGRQSNYEYDVLGNLLLTKDHAGNITTRYKYGLKHSQIHGVNFAMNNGSSHPGLPIEFTIYDEKIAGNRKYIWDFGDGTVVESSTLSIEHEWATVGTYSVTLVSVNPEYGSTSTSKTIIILPF